MIKNVIICDGCEKEIKIDDEAKMKSYLTVTLKPIGLNCSAYIVMGKYEYQVCDLICFNLAKEKEKEKGMGVLHT